MTAALQGNGNNAFNTVGTSEAHEERSSLFPREGAVGLSDVGLTGILPGKALNIEI